MKDGPIPEFMREVTEIWRFKTAPWLGQVFVTQDEQPRCIIREGSRYMLVTGSWECEYLTRESSVRLVDGKPLSCETIRGGYYYCNDGDYSGCDYGGDYSGCDNRRYYSGGGKAYYHGYQPIDETRWMQLCDYQLNGIALFSFGGGEFVAERVRGLGGFCGLFTKQAMIVKSCSNGEQMELEPRYKSIVHVSSHIRDRIQFYILDGLRLFRVVYTPF